MSITKNPQGSDRTSPLSELLSKSENIRGFEQPVVEAGGAPPALSALKLLMSKVSKDALKAFKSATPPERVHIGIRSQVKELNRLGQQAKKEIVKTPIFKKAEGPVIDSARKGMLEADQAWAKILEKHK